MLEGQLTLPVVPGPALIVGPVFLCFEMAAYPRFNGDGTPKMPVVPFKRKHAARVVVPRHGRPFVQEYPDPESRQWEQDIGDAARITMGARVPSPRPLALLVHVFKPIPESFSQRERALAVAGGIMPTTKPDWDNHGKITDALNRIVWLDDAQVVDGRVIKRYSTQPALRIEVREFIDPPLA